MREDDDDGVFVRKVHMEAFIEATDLRLDAMRAEIQAQMRGNMQLGETVLALTKQVKDLAEEIAKIRAALAPGSRH